MYIILIQIQWYVKNNYLLNISVIVYDKEIPFSLHTEGFCKGEEHIYSTFIALGPKIYGGIEGNHSFFKCKGLKYDLSLNDLLPLLSKDSKTIYPDIKMFRSLVNSTIIEKEDSYKLSMLNSKRNIIYHNNQAIYTIPKYIYYNAHKKVNFIK